MILDNRWITIREVVDYVDISFGSCQAIFTDVLGMKRAAKKIFPKLLNFEQKQRCMDVAQEMLTMFNDNPDLLKKVITGDESWVYGYDIEIKAQLSQWKRPEEPRSGSYPRSAIKTKYKKKYFFGDFLSADFWQKLWE